MSDDPRESSHTDEPSRDAPDGERPEEDDWDLDAEWAAARAATPSAPAARADRHAHMRARAPAEISAYALLYTGFLLGPLASLLGVVILMGRHFRLRIFIFALGICGASWCVAQGATLGLRASWSPEALIALRTLLNFSTGVILLGFVAARTDIYRVHNRKVWLNTGVFFLILLLVSTSLSPTFLFWLGR